MTTVRRTRRWRGVIAVALLAAAVGVFAARPTLLLAAVVATTYAVYPHLTTPPTVDYELERTFTPDSPADGDTVEVEVVLRNVSGEHHLDTRVVDGVPPMLSVDSGSPRHAAALRPGQETTFSYTVTATAGLHHFERATVIARDVSGAHETEDTVSTETTLSVASAVPEVTLREQTLPLVGALRTDRGGSGVEFHYVRQYQRGDPVSRVDWRRYARSRDLSTVEYHVEQAASVLLCVDARPCAYRSGAPDSPHAVSYAVSAAEQLLSALADTRHAVGVAAFARDPVWLPPGNGEAHVTRLRRRIASDPAFSAYPPDGDRVDLADQLARLRADLDRDTQVILLTPLPDQAVVDAAFTLEAANHGVTVISPDVATDGTLGERLSQAQRRFSVRALREADVPVVDWDPTRPVGSAIAEASERWSP